MASSSSSSTAFPLSMKELVYGDGEVADGLIQSDLDPKEVIPSCSVFKINGVLHGQAPTTAQPVVVGRGRKSAGPPSKRPKKGAGQQEKYEKPDYEEDSEDDEEEEGHNAVVPAATDEEMKQADSYYEMEKKILLNASLKRLGRAGPGEKRPWEETSPYTQYGQPRFDMEILTVVASVNLASKLDLEYIAKHARNIEYNPKRFSPLIMRVRYPKSTALMFASGKMIVAGTKTKAECKLAVRKYARVVQKLGVAVNTNFEIQNISASGNLGFPVRVHEMASDERIANFASYQADIFPGLVYSLVYPKVKAIIFVTGAVLMTGAKCEEHVREALEVIYPIAYLYRR